MVVGPPPPATPGPVERRRGHVEAVAIPVAASPASWLRPGDASGGPTVLEAAEAGALKSGSLNFGLFGTSDYSAPESASSSIVAGQEPDDRKAHLRAVPPTGGSN
jgi:hypothetical protein